MIAVSIFVDILVELKKKTNVSEAKIPINLLEVRGGALASFTHLSQKVNKAMRIEYGRQTSYLS